GRSRSSPTRRWARLPRSWHRTSCRRRSGISRPARARRRSAGFWARLRPDMPAPYLKRVYVLTDRVPADQGFPYHLPVIRNLDLAFKKAVTYLVGENGSGKSTLIEAIAEACGLPVSGGSRNELASRHGPEQQSALGTALRASFARRPRD